MPRTTYSTVAIEVFVRRLTDNTIAPHERISIAKSTTFNRGNEQDGVWSQRMKADYIDSILKGYPCGQISLVRDYGNAMNNYASPSLILDGANKSRALRDFVAGNFTVRVIVDEVETLCLFSNMPDMMQARFLTTTLSLSLSEILRDDPPSAISTMFTRLNTKQVPLSQGELIKAFSWRKNHTIPELAKNIIGGAAWNTHIASGLSEGQPYPMPESIAPFVDRIQRLRANWEASGMGELSERTRLDNFALLCGMIVAASRHNINCYDKRFSRLEGNLSDDLSVDTVGDVLTSLEKFVEVMTEIYHESVFGRVKCGMPSKKFTAYVFAPIINHSVPEQQRNINIARMCYYFAALRVNSDALQRFKEICSSGGDSHNTSSKFAQVRTEINTFIAAQLSVGASSSDEEEIETY